MQNYRDTVLLIEDDPCIRGITKHDLQQDGYEVVEIPDAYTLEKILKPDLKVDTILLDINLPDANGLDLISKIRKCTKAPIIIVSGRDGTTDRVIGLEMGADDYISKPIELREFMARIRAHVRRYKGTPQKAENISNKLKFGRWILDRSKYQIVDEEGLDANLTTKEFIILEALVASAGRTLTREQLFMLVRSHSSESYDRAVDVQITRIRHKICEDARNPEMIKTVRGIGYMFAGKVEVLTCFICLISSFCLLWPISGFAQNMARQTSTEPALEIIMSPSPGRDQNATSASTEAFTNKQKTSNEFLNVGLGQILRHVYVSNPSLRATRAELESIHELYPQALSGYRPTINLDTSAYHRKINSDAALINDGTTTEDLVLSMSQPIYRGGRTVADTARANSLIRAAYAGLQQGEQFIFLEVITAISDIVRYRNLLALRENNVILLEEELNAARARMQAGELTTTDSKQAEARLARARSEKIFTQNNLENSSLEFEQLVGYAPPENLEFPPLLFVFPTTHQQMVGLADQFNPEIQAAQHTSAAASHEIDTIFRQLLPQISAFLTLSKENNPQPGGISDAEAGTVGLRASMPLYEAGTTRSRVREAKNTARQREIEIEETRRRVIQNIMSDSHNLKAAEAEIEARLTEIDAAQLAREGVGAEARLGGRTVLDVLDADQELLDAKAARITAERNRIVNHYALAADLGLLRPERLGLAAIRYNPEPHYQAMGKRIWSMEAELNEQD